MDEVRIDPRQVEVVDDDMARVLRSKTGAERLKIAFGMFTSARRMLLSHLGASHPDWSQAEILRETARRLSHGAVSSTSSSTCRTTT
jgi:hypothetical protein